MRCMSANRISRRVVMAAPLALFVARDAWAASAAQSLFFVERSKNANEVHYDAMVTSEGGLDPKEPVVAYWIMKAQDGHREALTDEERRFGYGFSVIPDTGGAYRMTLVAYKDRAIALRKEGTRWRAEILIAGRTAWLDRIFIQTKEGLLPSVLWLELSGKDASTGQALTERISK
jgi:Domain of unknown function (DUF4833)